MNKLWLIIISIGILAIITLYFFGRTLWHPYWIKIMGKQSVTEVISKISTKHDKYFRQILNEKGIKNNPADLAYLAFKDVDLLEVWGKSDGSWLHITNYPILKASGELGPKLQEGDRQVPEGLYKIIGFNPNSAFHLSMKLNYPNKFDSEKAKLEGRSKPGSNIFIHGKESSIGCLAMGDEVIEKLFLLSHSVGIQNIQVIIAPTDFRKNKPKHLINKPSWTPELYANIEQKLQEFK